MSRPVKETFIIETPIGIVSKFSASLQMVQVTADSFDTIKFMKKFKTWAEAESFIDTYSDAGYGLSSKTASIKIL